MNTPASSFKLNCRNEEDEFVLRKGISFFLSQTQEQKKKRVIQNSTEAVTQQITITLMYIYTSQFSFLYILLSLLRS